MPTLIDRRGAREDLRNPDAPTIDASGQYSISVCWAEFVHLVDGAKTASEIDPTQSPIPFLLFTQDIPVLIMLYVYYGWCRFDVVGNGGHIVEWMPPNLEHVASLGNVAGANWPGFWTGRPHWNKMRSS